VSQRIITFTTDFGLSEHYVGAMKGVILSISPEAELVDISNSVQSFDILDGAITIAEAYDCFPSNTIHLVVVDPGVGTDRRPLLVSTTRHLFIAPDNGVLSLVYAREERVTVRHITTEHYFRQPVSQTFHGRDIFASVAGHLSKGVEPAKFGEEISDYARFAAPQPKPAGEAIKGVVIKVDKFGNLITNFTPKDLPQLFEATPAGFRMQVGKADVRQIRTAYAQGAAGEFFAILGSMGYLEISCNRGSAAQLAGAGKGSEVVVSLG
jgi:S-adenosyl-L-methionine hydrolase (adenosine-forming)